MKLADFDFDLPSDLVAQHPVQERDASRLMVVDRRTGKASHGKFRDLPEYLRPGDLLVINDSRVLPARLLGRKPTGGKVDVLLLVRKSPRAWEVFIKGIREGIVQFPEGVSGWVRPGPEGTKQLEFDRVPDEYLERRGLMPLPPYIRRDPEASDRERYQTVYARDAGSIAAPTAGLHFSEDLLHRIGEHGVEVARITLHVGPGTFMPVKADDVRHHRMPPEPYVVSEDSAFRLNAAHQAGRRIIAVGTTVTRTLESAFEAGIVRPGSGSSSLFIVPGFPFRTVTGLITNFHLPKGTPLMLVSAFLGLKQTRAAYSEAVRERYRFFSYGDAMLIL